jgi:hypothetical protein
MDNPDEEKDTRTPAIAPSVCNGGIANAVPEFRLLFAILLRTGGRCKSSTEKIKDEGEFSKDIFILHRTSVANITIGPMMSA